MRFLILIILVTAISCGRKFYIGDMVARKEEKEMVKLIQTVDVCFNADWNFDSVIYKPISHDWNGYLFFFHKVIGNDVIHRYYCFNNEGTFSESIESRFKGDTIFSSGRVYFFKKTPYLIDLKRQLTYSLNQVKQLYEVTFEVYNGCAISCKYVYESDNLSRHTYFKSKHEFEEWVKKPPLGIKVISKTCP